MVHVERLRQYTEQDAVELGLLRPILSPGSPDTPVDETLLTRIIESAEKEQLVARVETTKRIVGAATLNIVSGALAGDSGYLMDFVSDPNAGIKGIGRLVWNEMGVWCIEHGIDLEFTSRPTRTEAHQFYERQGAEIRDTTAFKKKFVDK